MKFTMAVGGIDGELIGQIVLGTDGGRFVVAVAIFPRLLLIDPQIRRLRDRKARQHRAIAQRRIEVDLLIAEVEADPQAFATVVERQRGDAVLLFLVVDRRAAGLIRAVEADAPLAIGAITPADIDGVVALRVGDESGREPRQRHVTGALRDQIDRPADGPERRHAAQHRARAVLHFDAFDRLERRIEGVGDAIQAVEGDVLSEHREAANEEALDAAVGRHVGAHGGIVAEHVEQRSRLLIPDELLREAGKAERRRHHVTVAEETHASTARDLISRKASRQGRLQSACRNRARLRCGASRVRGPSAGC
ncbi:hypothetical protein I8G32_02076 [Rhodopseudomonas palustris]|nr:hypothetical protein I8G32_02076 [Rhodopseudomonas palustris]